MFDFVQNNKRFVQIVLLLIVLTFTFWGVDNYNKSSDSEALATVNGDKIYQVTEPVTKPIMVAEENRATVIKH